jgi:hypothetical protein
MKYVAIFSAAALILAASGAAPTAEPAAPAPAPATFVTPLPTVTPLPITATSYPWLYYKKTQRPLELEKFGFVEEEYQVSGNANVYDWPADPAGNLVVKYSNAPYATRILVRRPTDMSKFNGTVIVETMNPARGFDMAIVHGFLSEHILEYNSVWVGVSMPGVLTSLKRYDAQRYARLGFANPAPETAVCGGGRGGGRGGGGGAAPAAPTRNPVEGGLRLDALAQIGRWMRGGPGNPLGNNVRTVLLVGHTGGDVATYVSSVGHEARLENGRPVYDGYIAHSGSNAGALMNCGTPLPAGDVRAIPGRAGAPVIVMKTESDLPYAGRADSDVADDVFRVWDIPASAHADKWLFRYLPHVTEQRKAIDINTRSPVTDEWPFDLTCDIPDIRMNQFPQGYIVSAGVAALEAYAKDKTPLPKAARVEMEGTGQTAHAKKDRNGNVVGGVRSPFVDVPTSTYTAHLTGENATCAEMVNEEKWDWWQTATMYGTYENYMAKVNASIDGMLKGRFITELGAKRLRAELVRPKARP